MENRRLDYHSKEMRPGLESSINAAYTPAELRELVKGTRIDGGKIESMMIGAILTGVK
jgi:hypothetical protein